jgi:hypothetical protein
MIKTEFPGYMKDDTPGQARAILNIDNASLQAYRDARAKDIALSKVVGEVNTLKNDIGDIKKLLTQLITGNK